VIVKAFVPAVPAPAELPGAVPVNVTALPLGSVNVMEPVGLASALKTYPVALVSVPEDGVPSGPPEISAVPEDAGPVSVTPFGMVRVPVDVVIVSPFTVVGVIAPRVIVRDGVAPPELVPDTPFAVVTPMLVTVPPPPPVPPCPPPVPCAKA
jgi:hypothetical protein